MLLHAHGNGNCHTREVGLAWPGLIAISLTCAHSLRSFFCFNEAAPVTSRILSSWFMVDDPGKMGFPVSSSPRMQPACNP